METSPTVHGEVSQYIAEENNDIVPGITLYERLIQAEFNKEPASKNPSQNSLESSNEAKQQELDEKITHIKKNFEQKHAIANEYFANELNQVKEEMLRLNQSLDSKALKIKELEGLIVRIVEQVGAEYRKNIQGLEQKITQRIEKKFQKQFESVGDCSRLVQNINENMRAGLEAQEQLVESRFAELTTQINTLDLLRTNPKEKDTPCPIVGSEFAENEQNQGNNGFNKKSVNPAKAIDLEELAEKLERRFCDIFVAKEELNPLREENENRQKELEKLQEILDSDLSERQIFFENFEKLFTHFEKIQTEKNERFAKQLDELENRLSSDLKRFDEIRLRNFEELEEDLQKRFQAVEQNLSATRNSLELKINEQKKDLRYHIEELHNEFEEEWEAKLAQLKEDFKHEQPEEIESPPLYDFKYPTIYSKCLNKQVSNIPEQNDRRAKPVARKVLSTDYGAEYMKSSLSLEKSTERGDDLGVPPGYNHPMDYEKNDPYYNTKMRSLSQPGEFYVADKFQGTKSLELEISKLRQEANLFAQKKLEIINSKQNPIVIQTQAKGYKESESSKKQHKSSLQKKNAHLQMNHNGNESSVSKVLTSSAILSQISPSKQTPLPSSRKDYKKETHVMATSPNHYVNDQNRKFSGFILEKLIRKCSETGN